MKRKTTVFTPNVSHTGVDRSYEGSVKLRGQADQWRNRGRSGWRTCSLGGKGFRVRREAKRQTHDEEAGVDRHCDDRKLHRAGLSPGGGNMGSIMMQGIKEGDDAHHSGSPGSVLRFSEVLVEENDERKKASDLFWTGRGTG